MVRILLALSLAASLACRDRLAAPVTEVAGTWGGENAGLIVSDSSVHVHIGCTLGDASGPIRPDPDGRFEASGTYNVDAYPVDRGIVHPARFSGRAADGPLPHLPGPDRNLGGEQLTIPQR